MVGVSVCHHIGEGLEEEGCLPGAVWSSQTHRWLQELRREERTEIDQLHEQDWHSVIQVVTHFSILFVFLLGSCIFSSPGHMFLAVSYVNWCVLSGFLNERLWCSRCKCGCVLWLSTFCDWQDFRLAFWKLCWVSINHGIGCWQNMVVSPLFLNIHSFFSHAEKLNIFLNVLPVWFSFTDLWIVKVIE